MLAIKNCLLITHCIIIKSYRHLIISSSLSYHHIIISSYHQIIIWSVEQKRPKSTEKSFNRPWTPSPRNVETWTFGKSGSFFEENWVNRQNSLKNFWQNKCFDVEKWNVGNRLKRVFPKFEADRSHPRGVKGRSKFSKIFASSKKIARQRTNRGWGVFFYDVGVRSIIRINLLRGCVSSPTREASTKLPPTSCSMIASAWM